jgi:hypothetical protein
MRPATPGPAVAHESVRSYSRTKRPQPRYSDMLATAHHRRPSRGAPKRTRAAGVRTRRGHDSQACLTDQIDRRHQRLCRQRQQSRRPIKVVAVSARDADGLRHVWFLSAFVFGWLLFVWRCGCCLVLVVRVERSLGVLSDLLELPPSGASPTVGPDLDGVVAPTAGPPAIGRAQVVVILPNWHVVSLTGRRTRTTSRSLIPLFGNGLVCSAELAVIPAHAS